MKITAIILAILAVLLCGCETPPNEVKTDTSPYISVMVDELTYKGHRYLIFHDGYGSRNVVMSAVHDPICPKCDSIRSN